MGLALAKLQIEVLAQVADPVLGVPVRTGGFPFDIQFMLPVADLVGLEGSADRATWHTLTDADGADINGPIAAIAVDDIRTVREQVEWVRLICEPDAAAGANGRLHRALIELHKPTS